MAEALTADAMPRQNAADTERIDPRRLIAFLCMVFGMFMAILDIQIVSASLTEIQAGLAASSNEISWVQTAYLIAEVVMIPLSGFLSRALGTRILFAASAAGFTAASLMCGLSGSINEMIFWRAVQGFIGGGMIPTVFATAFTIFPRSKLGIISPLIGLVATLAPTIGPTVGGYLTDAFSWHWLFFINIVPGIGVTVAALTLIDFDKPDYRLFDHFDWIGLLAMAGFLGALEYVLEEGPRNDWFADGSIVLLAWVSALSAILFFWRAFTAQAPIVDLKAFADRNFALARRREVQAAKPLTDLFVPIPHARHSWRNASIGLTRVARSPGSVLATSATTANTAASPAKVAGSCGDTSNSSAFIRSVTP